MNNYGKGLIQSAVEDVDRKFIKSKYELSRELNNALKNKYRKVEKNEEKYIELLKFNIIYYKSIIKKLETIVDVWIQNGVISSSQSVEKIIVNITNSSKNYVNKAMKEGIDKLNDKDRKIFVSYDKNFGLERLEKIENDYKILNIYKDVFGMVITEISSNVEKYKAILDMAVNEAKIYIMNEIFKLVNEILFSEDPNTSNFEDEALVDDRDMNTTDVEDSDKCISFKKYASMISTPEVLVKINDAFTTVAELEGVEEEDAYVFSAEMKDYVSCIVLLLDYISKEDKRYFKNVFRMFVIGSISEGKFKELCERYIRENLFLDSKTWLECQKNVKSDFNMENNKFFGENNSSQDSDYELSVTQRMDILMNLDENTTIRDRIESAKNDFFSSGDGEKISGFAEKLKKGISSFSDKLKMNEECDEEYYDEEYDEFDEEFMEEEEKKPGKFTSKLKSLFKKHDEEGEADEEDYYDGLEEIEIDPNLFNGDKTIQDREALAILKMRERSRIRDDEMTKKEYDKLRKERQLAEEINKSGVVGFIEDEDVVFYEEDYVYKKEQENKEKKHTDVNKDLFDNTIDGKNNSFVIEEYEDKKTEEKKERTNSSLKEESEDDDSEDFKPILGRTQRLNADKIKRATDKTTVIELEHINRNKRKKESLADSEEEKRYDLSKENRSQQKKNEESNMRVELHRKEKLSQNNSEEDKIKKVEDKNPSNKESVKDEPMDDGGKVFEELEAMKAMKTEGISVAPIDKDAKDKVDLSSFGKKVKKDESDSIEKNNKEEEFSFSIKKNSLKSKFKSFGESFKIAESDDEVIFSKKKMLRDTVIIIVIVIIIFFAYVFIIKGFKVPSVDETNKNVKIVQNKNDSDKNVISKNTNTLNEDTSKVSKKTEAEKEKDEAESKASELDREAEKYKGQKGVYYTVFVGATKDKDGADSVAYNFAQRGVRAKVIRNGGYYMLKVGEYFDYNQAYAESNRIGAKGIQNYIASRNKYYDLKMAAYQIRIPYLSNEQLKTDYDDLKNQISSTGKNAQYVTNLDEIYKDAMKDRQ